MAVPKASRWEEGIVKSGSFSIDQGVGVRAVSGEKTAFAYSDDISLYALESAAMATRAIGRQGGTQSVPLLSRGGTAKQGKKLLQHNAGQLYLPHDPIASIGAAEKVSLLERLERIARALDPRVTQVMAGLAGEYEIVMVARSDGLMNADIRPLVRLSLQVIVESNGKREQGSSGGGGRFDYAYFTEDILQKYAAEAVHQAVINLDARPAPAGNMTVILGSGWPGILLHEAVGHGLEGDFNRKGSSTFSGRVGERVASKGVTVVDDGTLADRRGSLQMDDEGNPTAHGADRRWHPARIFARHDECQTDGCADNRQCTPRILCSPADTAHDQYHDDEWRACSGGNYRLGQAWPVCGQLWRRAGGYYQRQVCILDHRSLHDRRWQNHLSGQGCHPDR